MYVHREDDIYNSIGYVRIHCHENWITVRSGIRVGGGSIRYLSVEQVSFLLISDTKGLGKILGI